MTGSTYKPPIVVTKERHVQEVSHFLQKSLKNEAQARTYRNWWVDAEGRYRAVSQELARELNMRYELDEGPSLILDAGPEEYAEVWMNDIEQNPSLRHLVVTVDMLSSNPAKPKPAQPLPLAKSTAKLRTKEARPNPAQAHN